MFKANMLIPLIVFILVIAAFRASVNHVVGEASKPSNVIPVSTPFVSPLCGPNTNKECFKVFEPYVPDEKKPFKGLQGY